MERIKETLLELGRKLGKGALALVRTTATTTADLLGRAAGHAASFAKEKGGQMVRCAGDKVKTTAKEHRQGLLLIAACVSGVALVASLIGYLLGRKK